MAYVISTAFNTDSSRSRPRVRPKKRYNDCMKVNLTDVEINPRSWDVVAAVLRTFVTLKKSILADLDQISQSMGQLIDHFKENIAR